MASVKCLASATRYSLLSLLRSIRICPASQPRRLFKNVRISRVSYWGAPKFFASSSILAIRPWPALSEPFRSPQGHGCANASRGLADRRGRTLKRREGKSTPNFATDELCRGVPSTLASRVMPTNESHKTPARAFGAPGIGPRWTHSAKEGIGTAYHSSCHVWFTISHGILNEP